MSANHPPQPVTGYVVVTVADNGVIHAWGHPATGEPFPEQSKARTEAARMRRQARKNFPEYADTGVIYRVCKLLTDPDQDGTNDAPACSACGAPIHRDKGTGTEWKHHDNSGVPCTTKPPRPSPETDPDAES